MLDAVVINPALAAPAIAGTGLRLCEINHLRDREMIVTLADLLRRRSRLALLYKHEELMAMEGLPELCDRLFGDQGIAKHEDSSSFIRRMKDPPMMRVVGRSLDCSA